LLSSEQGPSPGRTYSSCCSSVVRLQPACEEQSFERLSHFAAYGRVQRKWKVLRPSPLLLVSLQQLVLFTRACDCWAISVLWEFHLRHARPAAVLDGLLR
jgi:hypothetical protein